MVKGPFVDAKDQVAGWTIIQVRSREEAMGWAMRFLWPTPDKEVEGEIEVRQVFELEDFVQGPAIERFRLLATIDKIALDVERARPDLTSATARTARRPSCSRTSRGRGLNGDSSAEYPESIPSHVVPSRSKQRDLA